MDVLQPFLFWVIAGLTGACAIATVVTHNIVRSATWLLFTLAGTSGLFFLLGADVVGAVQLLVYVGGTLMLLIFGVMLTAQGPFVTMKTSSAEWAISAATGITMLGVLTLAIFSLQGKYGPPNNPESEALVQFAPEKIARDKPESSPNAMILGQGFTGVGVGPAHREAGKTQPVRAHYLLPFEIVSVHLLVVLIGAAYLARAKKRRGATS